jgi:hypothetical protein
MFHDSAASTVDMIVLPGVLGPQTLRRTVQVRLGFESLRLPGGTLIFTVSRHRIMKHPGQRNLLLALIIAGLEPRDVGDRLDNRTV